MDEISQNMVDQFNDLLKNEGSIVRLIKCNRVFGTVDIVLVEDVNVDSFVLNLSHLFYQKLEKFFEENYGFNLSYNNTGSCFWIKSVNKTHL